MLRLYHGGNLDHLPDSLWATPDFGYAAAFAELHESPVWMLTVDVGTEEILDLTGCGLDPDAVATDLLFAGIPARTRRGDERNPHAVLSGVSTDAIKAAGYRLVRIREWTDWGAGRRQAESVLIVDMTAICDRETVPLPDRNFQFPDGHETDQPRTSLVCPRCHESRGDRVSAKQDEIMFRCPECGHHWPSQ